MPAPPTRRLVWVVPVVLIVASLARIAVTAPDAPQDRDAALYIATAENLVRYGTYGVGERRHMDAAPLLSATLAVGLRLDPRHEGFRESGILTDHRAVRQINVVFALLLLAGVTATIALLVGTGAVGAASAAAAIVGLHALLLENPDVSHASLQELPAAAALVWTAFAAVRLVRGGGPTWAYVLGGLGGVLVLTRATFLYLFPVFLVLLVLVVRHWSPRRRVLAAMSGLLALALVAGPWVARNAITMGQAGISNFGGDVLLVRTVKNGMTPYQLRGAWVHFSPSALRPPLSRLLGVDPDDFLGDGPLRPLVRDLIDPVTGENLESVERRSFYRRAADLREGWLEGFVAEGVEPREAALRADRVAQDVALGALRSDPWSFLRTTPVFLHRSAWPLSRMGLTGQADSAAADVALGLGNVLGMAAIILAGVLGLLRRRPTWFALGGLPVGLVAFHALFTHALPRYTRPVVGVMSVLVVVGFVDVVRRLRERSPVEVGR